MIIRIILNFLLVLLLSMEVSATADQVLPVQAYVLAGGATLDVPQSFKVIKKDSGGDFVLYDVFDPYGQAVLSFFVGNFPSHEGDAVAEDFQSIQVPGFSEIDGKKWSCGRGYCAQVYINIAKYSKQGWPAYIHFWYNHNSATNAALADEMIKSLNFSKKAVQN